MKVGLDLRSMGIQHGGIERYTQKVYEGLLEIDNNLFYPFSASENYDLSFNKKLDFIIDLPISQVELANKSLAFMAGMNDIDIFYSPYYPLPIYKEFKTVITIHDLIPLKFKHFFGDSTIYDFFNIHIRNTANSSDIIIADSESTKKDIMELFNINSKKIEVVYLGQDLLNNNLEKDNSIIERLDVEEHSYLLSVCTIEPRKNLMAVLASFEVIKEKKEYGNLKLILTGSLGWKYEPILSMIENHPFKDDIILPGYVDDNELISLYSHALMFIYPSFYEGFGLPVLEAMSLGVPVVTSNVSSLPEVGGNAVLYCNPEKVETLTALILKLLNDSSLRNELFHRGKERAVNFTWNKTAKHIYDIFQALK